MRVFMLLLCLLFTGCMSLSVTVSCPPGTSEDGVKVSVSAKQEKNVNTNTNPSLTTGDNTVPVSAVP